VTTIFRPGVAGRLRDAGRPPRRWRSVQAAEEGASAACTSGPV